MLQEILSKLNQISSNNVRLFFISRKKRSNVYEYKVFKTQITSEIGIDFIEILQNNLNKYLDLGNIVYTQYDPTINMDRSNIEFLNKNEVDYLGKILLELKKVELELFDIENSKNLWAIAIELGQDIVYFRKYTKNKILGRSKILSFFFDDGVFNKLEKSILTIDQKVDCIYYNESIYILNKNQFELIFSFMDKFISEINNNIDNLVQKSLIENTSVLFDICKSDSKKVKKLNKILKSDILQTLNYSKIYQLNNQYNLDLEFTQDQKVKIDRKKIWTILKVLDDDYLKSPITDFKYEAHSKVKKG